MPIRHLTLSFSVSAFLCTARAFAGPVVNFDPGVGGTGINSNQTLGWSFDVLDPVTVTDLAWFDQDADGLSMAHSVGIWNPSGQLVVSTLIPAGTAAALDGIWRVVPVQYITLPVGNGYTAGGLNYATSTDRVAGGYLNHVLDQRIAYGESRYSPFGGQLQRPTLPSAGFQGLYGPGFNVIPVPEPATLALTLPLAAFFLRCRNRR